MAAMHEDAAMSSDGPEDGYKNHTFNKYENYMSGYETAKDLPKGKLLKVLAVPIFIATSCSLFILKSTKRPKRNADVTTQDSKRKNL